MSDASPLYVDPAIKRVRDRNSSAPVPPESVACVHCPKAIWMFVDRTTTAQKNAMPGMDTKPSWRCHCSVLNHLTYDDFAGLPSPECWVHECTVQINEMLVAAEPAEDA